MEEVYDKNKTRSQVSSKKILTTCQKDKSFNEPYIESSGEKHYVNF